MFSRFYEPISLVLISLLRTVFVKLVDVDYLLTSPLVFPVMTLKLHSVPLKCVVLLIWSICMDWLLHSRETGLQEVATFAAIAGVAEYMGSQKKHVLAILIACNAAGILTLEALGKRVGNEEHAPIERFFFSMLTECFYTVAFIVINGPLKVYLEIKEGKTSIEKIKEDYEDERTLMHSRFGVTKKTGILPTT
jgi:hypothetical protein